VLGDGGKSTVSHGTIDRGSLFAIVHISKAYNRSPVYKPQSLKNTHSALRTPTFLKIQSFPQLSGVFYKWITSLSLRERDGDESVVL
jgi:hypothetical protein